MTASKEYVFASARVRGAEKNLLTREMAEKMADSRNADEALRILLDLGYGGEDAEARDNADTDSLLSRELMKTYDFILEVAPDKSVFDPFFCPYEYHNLKVLLKAEFAETDPEPALIHIGALSPEQLTEMVRERSFSDMSETMRNAVSEAIEVFSRTKDPQRIDFILDRACYAEMSAAAGRTGSRFIQDYVRLSIDLINLKTFIRIREMKRPWEFLKQVFLAGGSLDETFFEDSFEDSLEQLSEKLLSCGLSDIVSEGGAALSETGRFTVLEKLCDDKLISFAEDAKYVSFGVEPLAAYLIAREGDIRLARIILAGLEQGLAREAIAERMRKTYV